MLNNRERSLDNKFLSCNGYGLSPVKVITGLLFSSFKSPEWFKFDDHDVIFTYQGRYAVGLICKIWNIGPGDEVLLPAYNCGAEIDPFIKSGAKAVLYSIDNRSFIDVDDIISRVNPATRIIYITHFFGWPQDINELAEYCRRNEILLVEDCAQSLFSKRYDNIIGEIGDASIYSFVKSLPAPDGGALVIRKKNLAQNRKKLPPEYQDTIYRVLPLMKKWFMHKNGFWQRYKFTRDIIIKSGRGKSAADRSETRPEMLESNYFDEQKKDWDMSGITKQILKKIEPEKIIHKRRRNYLYLCAELQSVSSIKILFNDLPENVCPMSFPLFFKIRKEAYRELSKNGILVQGWPGYYPGLNWDDFPEACNLKDNLLTLPVHQDLDIHHMEYIAECVKAIGE